MTEIDRRLARSLARRQASLSALRAAMTRLQVENGLQVDSLADALAARDARDPGRRTELDAVYDELIILFVLLDAAIGEAETPGRSAEPGRSDRRSSTDPWGSAGGAG